MLERRLASALAAVVLLPAGAAGSHGDARPAKAATAAHGCQGEPAPGSLQPAVRCSAGAVRDVALARH